jgi:hypothetical protein
MTDRESRIAKNEGISREINESIEDAMTSLSPEGYVRMVCECGLPDCELRIAITVAEYEDARRDARRFVVASDHVIPDMERVVTETERYTVVEKREGTPAAVAEASDPRD